MDRPTPPPPPYVSMRTAAAKLREEEWRRVHVQIPIKNGAEVVHVTNEVVTILEHLASAAEGISQAGGFIDHEPYLSATALAKKILGT